VSLGLTEAVKKQVWAKTEVNDRDGGCVAFVLDILFLWALCNITPNIKHCFREGCIAAIPRVIALKDTCG